MTYFDKSDMTYIFGFVIYYSTSATTTIMLYETVYFANTSCMIFITSVFSFNHDLQAKHATMLSYDIIPCNDGHLEERKKKKRLIT